MKTFMKSFTVMLRFVFISSLTWVLASSVSATVVYSSSTNKLFIPYLEYKKQNYDAEWLYCQDCNELAITQSRLRQNNVYPVYGQRILVDEQLNLHLPRINVEGSFYQAELAFMPEQNTFSVSNLQPLDEHNPLRGELLATNHEGTYRQSQIIQLIAFYSLQNGVSIDLQAANDVDVFTISYQTLDPGGELTPASALIAFPTGLDTPSPLVAYQHGTLVKRSDALTENTFNAPTLGLAASGYVVVSADYLGFGASKLLHPYIHAHSLAISLIDALRAVRKLAETENIDLNQQLFLAGYSEGGYATLALQRELETHHADEFSITASAPMAGSYDLSGTMVQRILDPSPHPNPYYFSYIVLMLEQVYGLFDDFAEVFQAPYNTLIPNYFDGEHDGSEINAYLPNSTEQLYQATILEALNDPGSKINAALAANDLIRWKPTVPTRLYHCQNDEQVPFANSQVAYDNFQARGATNVELIIVDDSGFDQNEVHGRCGIQAILMAKEWFDSLVSD